MFEIGSSLRDARLRKGLELAELEAETKIRAKYLRALEEERFELLPGDTYVKGFLRIYAERLGLDGQLYVDEFSSRYALGREEPVVATRTRRRSRQARFETHAVVIALAAIVAITVLVIAAWRIGGSEGDPSAEATAPSVTAPEAAIGETGEGPAADPPPVQLILTARTGASRLEVRQGSANGELVWEGTLRKGDDIPVEGTRLWILLARAQNVALTLNGEPVPPLGRGERTVIVTTDGVRETS